LEYFGLKSLDDLPKIENFTELKPVEEKKNEPDEAARQN
jgi:chromosome segregation and condensation protein ScpB